METLPDVAIPAVDVPAVTDADSGEVLVPAYTLPAQVAEAGCVVRYDAPGGCVGAVDISAAQIPAVTVPALELDGRDYAALTIPGVSRPGVHVDEVCQVEEDGGLPTVTRPGLVREGFSRPGGARPGDDVVATVRLDAVELPDVDIDPVRLSRQELAGGVGRLDGDDRTSYVAPAQVLFDTDSAELRPGAGPALREIATQLRAEAPDATLLIEGHTDDRGDADYGLRLSGRRAETVAQWLVREAGFDPALIATQGWGEQRPAYPNDSDAHRQLNRRVVITVQR
ncbi:MAG TPA: OmpA family protein [Nocardioides sp.]|uniref:OmpA family protein n=1 Tax=uncultured Nocardioides sp. TaxID=198441 RepID=UPI000ED2DBBB|nr:OmpA family protein [uncultured Nocardioides sp.]HCB03891.1 hypothetical protein [Nocardioides sp.]HRI98356.1 OmpA family protein [Nocardioides sp.]